MQIDPVRYQNSTIHIWEAGHEVVNRPSGRTLVTAFDYTIWIDGNSVPIRCNNSGGTTIESYAEALQDAQTTLLGTSKQ